MTKPTDADGPRRGHIQSKDRLNRVVRAEQGNWDWLGAKLLEYGKAHNATVDDLEELKNAIEGVLDVTSRIEVAQAEGDVNEHDHAGGPGSGGAIGIVQSPIVIYPDDPDEPLVIPGPKGAAGPAGPAVVIYPDDPDDPLVIPGPKGETGNTGTTGSAGRDGLTIPGPPGQDGEDPVYFLLPASAHTHDEDDLVPDTVAIEEYLAFKGIVTDASTGLISDFAPAGWPNVGIIRLTGALPDIDGLVAGTDGQVVIFEAVGSNPTFIRQASSASAAANRFYTPDNIDLNIRSGGSIMFRYDATLSLWRVVGTRPSDSSNLGDVITWDSAGSAGTPGVAPAPWDHGHEGDTSSATPLRSNSTPSAGTAGQRPSRNNHVHPLPLFGTPIVLFPDEPDEPLIIPGPKGDQGTSGGAGSPGATGPAGPAVAIYPDDPDDPLVIPGPRGATGERGPTVVIYPDDPDDPLVIPGPKGDQGATGGAGSTGATGPAGPAVAIYPDDPDDPLIIPGPRGATGERGPAVVVYPDDPDDPLVIPGPRGADGSAAGTVSYATVWKYS